MKLYRFIKDFFDIIFSIFLLFLLLPIMAICAIAIKIEDSSGPVLFKQDRVGKGNKVFKVLKFRTMKVGRKRDSKELSDSERMLKTGFFLRKASFDELPQLFNIIKGDMSFIGPRPLPVIYLPYYNEHEILRHDVKPGISGWAQVNGRNNIKWEEKFAKDLEYIDRLSFSFDIKIFFLTILKVFQKSDVVIRGENSIMDFHEYRLSQEESKSLV